MITQTVNVLGLKLPKIDPRWWLIINHITLVSLGLIAYDMRRSAVQVGFAFACGILSEILFSAVTRKQVFFSIRDRLMSATILCSATIILVRAEDWWFYGLMAVIGVASKYLLVNDKGRHLFNPTNFAVVFAVMVMPLYLQFRPDTFSASWVPMAVILCFAGMATITAKSWRAPLAYMGTIFLVGLPLGMMLGYHPVRVIGPEISVTTLLFCLAAMTDPQTSPRAPKQQLLYGSLIALVALFLRYNEVYYHQFVALFVVTCLNSVLFSSPGLPPQQQQQIGTKG
ncbi:MAG: hypothetical protein GC134_01290 [Proteobacteria bacterium]|nr:hypothetical protein [Pseudomonadota bacterium]